MFQQMVFDESVTQPCLRSPCVAAVTGGDIA